MDNISVPILIAVGTFIGVAMKSISTAIIDLFSYFTGRQAKKRKDTLEEYSDLFARQQIQLNKLSVEVGQLRLDNMSLARHSVRADERIQQLEDILRQANIPFRPWREPESTHSSVSLKPLPLDANDEEKE